MSGKIIAATSADMEYGDIGGRLRVEFMVTNSFNPRELMSTNWDDVFPGSVITKCQHCGQWGARRTACKHCGAPID